MDTSTPARTANLLGALALATSDRLRRATEDAAGHGAAAPAALVALRGFLDGGSVDQLRDVVGLTASGAVRLADRLEADGHLRRGPGRDGRSKALHLTARGQQVADRIQASRADALIDLLDDLDSDDQQQLTALLERLLDRVTMLRLAERTEGELPSRGWLCRLCDLAACGRDTGHCPTANAAAAALGGEPTR